MNSPITHTTFINLIKKTLKALDNYGLSSTGATTDLTRATTSLDQNTSGEVMGICINLALHTIYDLIKDSKYLKALPSTKLVSTADQAHIDLDVEPNLDEIEALLDTTNNLRLTRKSWSWYRRHYPNPAQSTGTPVFYARRWTRIYLAPTPSAAVTYTCDFVKNTNDLVNDNDFSLLPTQYDYWILAEAMVWWFKMEDANSVPVAITQERDDIRQNAMNAVMSGFDTAFQSASHFGPRVPLSDPYNHPNLNG